MSRNQLRCRCHVEIQATFQVREPIRSSGSFMLTLGIETSGPVGSIALISNDKCLEQRVLKQRGRRHAQTLVSEIDSLFRAHEYVANDCDAVAVSIGPGSFTGLRVGVVCAKTWAYATNCRFAAVETFLSIAENSPDDVSQVSVIDYAQRDELYVGQYRRQPDGHFECEGGLQIVNGQKWCGERSSEDVVNGPGIDRFEESLSDRCRQLDPEMRQSNAATIAQLGRQKLLAGQDDDYRTAEPLYLRKSAAEEQWNDSHNSRD